MRLWPIYIMLKAVDGIIIVEIFLYWANAGGIW